MGAELFRGDAEAVDVRGGRGGSAEGTGSHVGHLFPEQSQGTGRGIIMRGGHRERGVEWGARVMSFVPAADQVTLLISRGYVGENPGIRGHDAVDKAGIEAGEGGGAGGGARADERGGWSGSEERLTAVGR
jgi:hypothetical protein